MGTHPRKSEAAIYADAFAKALAVFLQEVGISTPAGPVPSDLAVAGKPRGHVRKAAGQASSAQPAMDRELERELRESVVVTPALLSDVLRQRLKETLAESGLSQRDLAQRMGVSPAVVTRILQHPERSRLDTLLRVAKALGADLQSLLVAA